MNILKLRKMTKGSRYGGTDYHTIMYAAYPVYQAGQDGLYNEEGLSNVDNPLFRKAIEQKFKAEVEEEIWSLDSLPLRKHPDSDSSHGWNGCFGNYSNLTRFIRDTETYPIDWKFGFAPYPTMEPGQDNYLAEYPFTSPSNYQDC